MKLLRNKTYQGMVEEINRLKVRNELNEKVMDELEKIENKRIQEIENLKKENKKLTGAKGGHTKEINKLKKKVEELELKLKESMTDKYLVKKIPSGRRPKSQPMKVKDCSRISNISRNVFSKE